MKFLTEQETFWAKEFGNKYINRNKLSDILPKKINLFSEILKNCSPVKKIIEFGPNTGANLIAINTILPLVKLSAVEINSQAVTHIKKLKLCEKIWNKSMLDFKSKAKYDLSFTSGVLIHINPEYLDVAYKSLYENSKRYILIIQYYNPYPIEIDYRGHKNRLFKRDFAGDIMSKYKNVKLVNYGFKYKSDNNFPLDDVTWFLLEKKVIT